MKFKLQKILAQTGIGSRRSIEQWIVAGRVRVNGQVAHTGERVDWDDCIEVDGERVLLKSDQQVRPRVLIYNKPVGEICTRHDPQGRETVFAKLSPLVRGRWISIGRLDINSSGLLLFTDNGDLAHHLMHPSTGLVRTYLVRVLGEVTPVMLKSLHQGVLLEDGRQAHFDSIQLRDEKEADRANRWYEVTLSEGRQRIVRRLWEARGCTVSRLHRIGYGPIQLPKSLQAGTWQELGKKQLELILK